MADERRIFPTETVLELVTGKQDADTSDLASFLMGMPVTGQEGDKAAASFAAAWLARWYPKFMDLDWKDDGNWQQFVAQAKGKLGDSLSLAPLSGPLKKFADEVLVALQKSHESLMRQTDAAVQLEQRVRALEPLEAGIQALQKKNDQLEEKLKATRKDMGALQRQANEFEGKMAIDHDELLRTIKDAVKDAIKDNLRGLVAAGGATAGAAEALAAAESGDVVVEEAPAEDEWGFKSKRKKKSDW